MESEFVELTESPSHYHVLARLRRAGVVIPDSLVKDISGVTDLGRKGQDVSQFAASSRVPRFSQDESG